ncbi:MAG: F0F1 ATP synthase subunit A [Planctomycetes bacterium]|nr:F0F1 ATP synthase subunit A [Planctomycetota bacterium]
MFFADAFEHVLDSPHWHFFDQKPHLPWILTRYMVLMLLAAGIIITIYVPIARKARSGGPPRGPWWNAFESILTFIRDQVAKPCIGHGSDHYVPFLWSIFLFVLFCNLLGMFPFLGSPTASFSVTLALALIAFLFIHGSAVAKMGPIHYFQSYVPHIDVPFGMGYFIVPMIVLIEVVGNFIKAFVLAVRLFANMFAGHLVLAFLLLFIVMVKDSGPLLFWGVTVASVLGVVALSLLELFVAFLQAFIFTFLTALFLGMSLHPEH